MDVKKTLYAVACLFALSACSNQKSVSSVFADNGALDSSACRGQAIENRFIVQWEDGSFSVEESANVEEFKATFIEPQLNNIKQVEFDRYITKAVPEQSFSAQGSAGWGVERIRAPQVWAQGYYGQNVQVAVIDSFVDTSHQQLAPQIAINTREIPNNGRDDDNNGVVDDYYGASFVSVPGNSTQVSQHGTHVAGIIAANPNFGSVYGVAPQAKIIPAQFISNDGGGSLGDAVLALQYAARRGAKIINASWGGAPCVASLRDAFAELEKQGILIVVAAGNEGRNLDVTPNFPAAFSFGNQITVAASTELDIMAGWSNNGFRTVHLAAPGTNIFSTVPGGTAFFDGTSMAAPLVSGVASLLWSAKPQATAAQIRRAIFESVSVVTNQEFKTSTRGRIDAERALIRLQQIVP